VPGDRGKKHRVGKVVKKDGMMWGELQGRRREKMRTTRRGRKKEAPGAKKGQGKYLARFDGVRGAPKSEPRRAVIQKERLMGRSTIGERYSPLPR
jgi:hypothetical protein